MQAQAPLFARNNDDNGNNNCSRQSRQHATSMPTHSNRIPTVHNTDKDDKLPIAEAIPRKQSDQTCAKWQFCYQQTETEAAHDSHIPTDKSTETTRSSIQPWPQLQQQPTACSSNITALLVSYDHNRVARGNKLSSTITHCTTTHSAHKIWHQYNTSSTRVATWHTAYKRLHSVYTTDTNNALNKPATLANNNKPYNHLHLHTPTSCPHRQSTTQSNQPYRQISNTVNMPKQHSQQSAFDIASPQT
jgi:hypothetical protein